jgi:hypothetical protein
MAEEVTAPVRSDALPNSEDEWAALLRFYRGRCDVSPATFHELTEPCFKAPFPMGVNGQRYTPINSLHVHVRYDVEDGILHPCTCSRERWHHIPKHDDQIPH